MMASMAEWHSWDLGSQYSCNAVPIARPSQGGAPLRRSTDKPSAQRRQECGEWRRHLSQYSVHGNVGGVKANRRRFSLGPTECANASPRATIARCMSQSVLLVQT